MDRVKVVKAIECRANGYWQKGCIVGWDVDCPYAFNHAFCDMNQLLFDALALLKEQEPVKPKQHLVYTTKGWFCGVCDGRINRAGKYCAFCGRPVKWE